MMNFHRPMSFKDKSNAKTYVEIFYCVSDINQKLSQLKIWNQTGNCAQSCIFNSRTVPVLPSLHLSHIFPFHLLPSPVHPTRFFFYIVPGFLAIFILLISNNNNNALLTSWKHCSSTARVTATQQWTCREIIMIEYQNRYVGTSHCNPSKLAHLFLVETIFGFPGVDLFQKAILIFIIRSRPIW